VNDDRNPLFIPETKSAGVQRTCPNPECRSPDFDGRNLGGVIIFTCAKCKMKFGGGIPHSPVDPSVPYPADPSPPSISYTKHPKTGEMVELRRPQSTAPDFRKGAPVPPGGEDV
jgi:hypothetical protein